MPVHLSGYELGLAIPLEDPIGGHVVWPYQTVPFLVDDFTVVDDVGNRLLRALLHTLADTAWLDIAGPNNFISGQLTAPRTVVPCVTPKAVEILLSPSPNAFYQWRRSADVGKYGIMRILDGGYVVETHFLNSVKQGIQIDAFKCDAVEFILNAGVTGGYGVFQWLGVPPVLYNYQGDGWFPVNSDTEYNGNYPPPPIFGQSGQVTA